MLIAASIVSRLCYPLVWHPLYLFWPYICRQHLRELSFFFFFPPPSSLSRVSRTAYDPTLRGTGYTRFTSRLRIIYVIDWCIYRETHRRHFCSISREISRRCRDRRSSLCRRARIPFCSPNGASWAADNRRDRPHPGRHSWRTWKRRPRNCKKMPRATSSFYIANVQQPRLERKTSTARNAQEKLRELREKCYELWQFNGKTAITSALLNISPSECNII